MAPPLEQAAANRGVPLSIVEVALPEARDLYRSGLTSHGSVNIMLALEDKFNIEFPAHMLRKSTFESIRAIEEANFFAHSKSKSGARIILG